MSFADHFSGHADDYARYRPGYPSEVFEWIASVSDTASPVWDCGTGNGQAAVALAQHFPKVFATDPSSHQVAEATAHPAVEYSVGSAEISGLLVGSVGTVMVAQALHWFDHPKFFIEAGRVARRGARMIVLGYTRPFFDSVQLDEVFAEFAAVVEEDWPLERAILEGRYEDVKFPFEKAAVPEFQMAFDWPLAGLLGYLGTWSAVRRHEERTGENAVELMAERFASAWGAESTRLVEWPLVLISGVFN